jgi:flagellar motor switch protein FliM
MSMLEFKNEARPGSLIRPNDGAISFPGLERIGDKFTRGLRQIIADLGSNDAVLSNDQIKIKAYGAVRIDHAELGAYCLFKLDMIKGGALVILPPALVRQLVDIFYGGPGSAANSLSEFSAAELRFVGRIAQQFLPLFKVAWTDIVSITASVASIETDIDAAAFAKDHDLVAVQSFTIGSGSSAGATVKCVYTTLGIRGFPAMSKSATPEPAETDDPVWRDKLTDAVMHVHLPVRSIFARQELPLAKLLNLQSGDIIPVCLPRHLPMTVSGRIYAHGIVGESSGRAAIRIEKMEEGRNQDD